MTWYDVDNYIVIPLPNEFDRDANIGYLTRETNECMYKVENDTITRVIAVGGIRSLVQIHVEGNKQMTVRFLNHSRPAKKENREDIVNFICDWFDLHNDLAPFYDMAKTDPLLKIPAEKFYGLRIVGIPDLFEALCWGVLGQQINLAFAYRLKKQFIEQFGESIQRNGEKYWIFPTYEQVAKLKLDDFNDIKMTEKKKEYIIGIAQLMANGNLAKEKLMKMEFKEAEKSLTSIRGIGPWTANYVLMRCLRFPNAFPVDDVGLHNSIKTLHGMDRKPTKEEILTLAKPWKNMESYATFYLWRVLY